MMSNEVNYLHEVFFPIDKCLIKLYLLYYSPKTSEFINFLKPNGAQQNGIFPIVNKPALRFFFFQLKIKPEPYALSRR